MLEPHNTMLRLGRTIRLTPREIEGFAKITDIAPVGIRTLDELDAYVGKCKAHFWGISEQTKFIHWLIDCEYRKCFGDA